MASRTSEMKNQLYDRFGGGLIVLIVLIMLTIAVVAGQAQANFADKAATKVSVESSETSVAEPGNSPGQ